MIIMISSRYMIEDLVRRSIRMEKNLLRELRLMILRVKVRMEVIV